MDDALPDEVCAGLLGSATAAPEIEGWTTTGGAPFEDEPSPELDASLIVVPDVEGALELDGALPDELDDEDERACGAGSGAGPPPDAGAACGEGSGFGDACAMPGSAKAITTTSVKLPTNRVTIDAAAARAVRVSEPLRRVPQLGRAPTSPSQL